MLTSKDTGIITSEGGVLDTNISPPPPPNVATLKQQQHPITLKHTPLSDDKFQKVLNKIPKKPESPVITTNNPLPSNVHNFFCPTPKTSSIKHSTIGQPRFFENNVNRAASRNNLQHMNLQMNHMFDTTGKKQSLDALLKGPSNNIWSRALSNKLGRLAQGVRDIKGNNAVDFIPFLQVPSDRIVTYANMVCDIRPLKSDKFWVRLTVGGDRLQYPDDTVSPAATLLETKLLLNSIISQSAKGARFMTLDIKDFFLQSVMDQPEYMKIHAKYFLPEICEKYNINELVHTDSYVFCKIKRGMYGLKQAARLAYDSLKKHLQQHGYFPDKYSQNILGHTTQKRKFCLCVDDFGVQYFNRKDAQHLIDFLQHKYIVPTDFTGKKFCGLDIVWD